MNLTSTLYLLAFPIGLMGVVQICFSLLAHLLFRDGLEAEFFFPAICMIVASTGLLFCARDFDASKITYRESLLYAALTWVVMGLTGAIPIVEITGVSVVDGVFESISALTTTGATILTGLDAMPKSFLMYRQFLQWLS